MGPKCDHKCPGQREAERDFLRRGGDTVLKQEAALPSARHRALEARKGEEEDFPMSLWREQVLAVCLISAQEDTVTAGLQAVREAACGFKPPRWWSLSQQQEETGTPATSTFLTLAPCDAAALLRGCPWPLLTLWTEWGAWGDFSPSSSQ